MPAITALRRGQAAQGTGLQVIVPSYNFSCNGVITSVTIGATNSDTGFIFQIWQPQQNGICHLQHSVNTSRLVQRIGDQLTFNVTLPVMAGDLIGYRLEPNVSGSEMTFLLDVSNASRNVVTHRHVAPEPVCQLSLCGDQTTEYGSAPQISVQFGE